MHDGRRSNGRTLAEQLRALRHALERVLARFDDDVDRVARVAKILDDLSTEAEGTDSSAALLTAAQNRVLREAARVGCGSLGLKWRTDGSAAVRIDDGAAFLLAPQKAALLDVIASPQDGDGVAPWLTYDEVAARLSKRGGRPTSTRHVAQSIYTLRLALRRAGQNWFLVQTDRRGSVRFALRSARGAAGPEPSSEATTR
jgi:hypothetical protein